MDCLICHEDIIRTGYGASIECGHVFHGKCVIKWLRFNETCPICRQEVSGNSVRPLYLWNTQENDENFKFSISEKAEVAKVSIELDERSGFDEQREDGEHRQAADVTSNSATPVRNHGPFFLFVIQIGVVLLIAFFTYLMFIALSF